MTLSLPGLIIIAVLFLGLLFIFTPLVYRPYLQVLDARDELEAHAGHETENRPELQELEAKIASSLAETEAAARKENAEARARVVAGAQGELDGVRDRLAQEAAGFRESLTGEVEAARGQLGTEAETLAHEIGAKVLGRAL